MTTDDVHGDDMAHPELSDEQLAALLEGSPGAATDHPVADALAQARQQLDAEPVPTPGAALSEYLGVGRVVQPIPPSAIDGTLLELSSETENTPRRIPVLTSLSAFIGTLTGKLLVSSTIAVASIGGAHATGVVDVPGLPDIDSPSVTETLDRDDDSDNDNSDRDNSDNDEIDNDDIDQLADDDDRDDDGDNDGDDSSASTTVPSTSTVPPSTTAVTSTTSVPSSTTSTVPSSTTSTVPTSTTAPPSQATTHSYSVPGVGTTTVSVFNGQITLVSAVPAAGWTLDEAGPDEDGVESKYTKGELETRIDFEIENGQLRVRIRERNDATDERTERFEYFPL